jgi:tetratricopeptide (TPR) repeat protein
LQEYRLLNDRAHEAVALHNLAEAKEQLGDLKSAHRLLEAAVALNSTLKSDDQWWRDQIALLQVEAKADSTNELAARFEKLSSKQPANRGLKALLLNERGLWNSRTGDFSAAGTDFGQALQLFNTEKNESGSATVMANQALLLERQGKHRQAAESWRLAQTKFEALANPIGIALSMAGRGRALLAAHEQLPVAEDLLRRAAENFRVLHEQKDAQEAAELLRKALEAQGKTPADAT